MRVIDFGRAALRPALTDFARIASQQFRGNVPLEAPFLNGNGHDPGESAAWQREQQRHPLIAEALRGG